MQRRNIALIVGLVLMPVCNSTNTRHTFKCWTMDYCELRAEKKCGTKNYLVIERHVPPKSMGNPGEKSSGHDISGALKQGQGGSRSRNGKIDDRDDDDAISIVVECNPPPKQPQTSTTHEGATRTPSPEELAARESNKATYMKEVCELVNPDLRREELRIARQLFGDVSCN